MIIEYALLMMLFLIISCGMVFIIDIYFGCPLYWKLRSKYWKLIGEKP